MSGVVRFRGAVVRLVGLVVDDEGVMMAVVLKLKLGAVLKPAVVSK